MEYEKRGTEEELEKNDIMIQGGQGEKEGKSEMEAKKQKKIEKCELIELKMREKP